MSFNCDFEDLREKTTRSIPFIQQLNTYLKENEFLKICGIEISDNINYDHPEVNVKLHKKNGVISNLLIYLPYSQQTNWVNNFNENLPMVYEMMFLKSDNMSVPCEYFNNQYYGHFYSPKQIMAFIVQLSVL